MPQGLKEVFYHIHTCQDSYLENVMYVPECALFSLATLTNFDSKKWNSFLAYVHCRHSNLPFYKMEKQGFLFLSWDHLKPVHSNVNLVLQ
jgi:hypothetical protein